MEEYDTAARSADGIVQKCHPAAAPAAVGPAVLREASVRRAASRGRLNQFRRLWGC